MHHRLCTSQPQGLVSPDCSAWRHPQSHQQHHNHCCALPSNCPCCTLQPPLSTLPQFYFPTKAPINEAESACKELVASIDKSFASNASGLQLLDFVEAVQKVRAQQQGRRDKRGAEGSGQWAVSDSTHALSRCFISTRRVWGFCTGKRCHFSTTCSLHTMTCFLLSPSCDSW